MNSAAGSSDREMSKIEDSISYKLNALKETWAGFLQVAGNRASIKIIIDFLTKVSELLVKVLEMPGANVAVISGAIALLGTLVQKAKDASSPLLTLSSIFKELFGKESPLSNVQNVEKGVIETVNKMKETAQSGVSPTQKTIWSASGQVLTVVDTEATKKNTEANLKNAASNEAKAASEIKDSAVKKDNIATTEADSVATDKNTAANKNNIASLLSLVETHWKASLGIGAVVAALGALYAAYKYDTTYVDKLNEKTQDLLSTFQQQKSEIDSNIRSVQSVSDEYYKLASGVDSYGNNISLSNENFERYNEISNQIAETFPELVSGYTDTGDAILSCKDSVDALNQACKDESLSAYSDLLKDDNLSKILEDIGIRINGRDSFFSHTKGTEQKEEDLKTFQEYLDKYKDIINELKNNPNANIDAHDLINELMTKATEFNIDPDLLALDTDDLDSTISGITLVEKSMKQAASDLKEDEEAIVSDFNTCVSSLLDSSDSLNGLDDTTVKNIKTYLSKFSVDDVNDILDGATGEEAVKKVNDFVEYVVQTFSSGENAKTVRDALNNLMSLDLSDSSIAKSKEEINKYINILAKYLDEDPQVLKVKLGVDTTDAISNRNVAAGKNLLDSSLPNSSEWQKGELEELRRYTDQFTEAESQEWLDWANSVETSFKDVDAIIAAHEKYLKDQKVNGQSSFDLTSFSSTIDSLGKINTAYQKVAENIKANKIGKEIVSDINDIEVLREEFKDLSDTDLDFGSFGSGMEGFDEIERVLTSSSSSAAEMQLAFDQLGNTLVNAKMAANDYDEASQQLVSSQLQQAGATKESADAYVANTVAIHQAKEQVAEASGSVENATVAEILTLAQEGNVSTEVAAALLELAMEKVNANNTTIMTSGDIDNLYKLMVQAGATTDQLNALAIAKANASDAEGFSKTGAGGMPSSAIENQKKQASKSASKTASDFYQDYKDKHKFNFSYTPPKSSSGGGGGGGGGNSSEDKEDSYIEKYKKQLEELGKLRDQDKMDTYEYLQYTRALYEKYFNSVNTPNKEWNSYVKLKKQYDELVAAKANLAKQDTKANKSSVNPELQKEQANIKELTAEYADLQKQLEEAKAARKASLADDWMGNVNLNDRPTVPGNTMTAAGWDGSSGSYSTILTNTYSFDNPINGSPWTVQFTPILPDGSVLDEQSCLDYVQSIIESATSKEDAMAKDKAGKGIFMGVFDTYQDQSGQTVQIDWDKNIEEAEQYYDQLAQLRHEDQADIYNTEGEIIVQQQQVQDAIAQATGEIQSNVQSTGETVKDTVDGTGASAESVEAQIQAVQAKLSEAEKNMSDDTREYLEQLRESEYNYLSGMKELYDNVFSYLSGQIDKQISKLNDQKSKATDNLKSQKESAVNALKAEKEAAVNAIEAQIDAIKEQQKQIQKQIDAYQDEIDAINDANEARERELTLQKALYDLDKLQNQRTNLVYSESQGMHYEADLSGIRDARESVQDAKDDIAIANLQKKIDLLEKEKDALDDQIDALEEQKQAIEDYYDDLISQTEEYWDNLITESEKYYDNLVKQLQGQKDLITEWQDALENAKFNAIIEDLTGKDAHEIFGDFENFDTSKLEELKGLLGDLATQYVSLETTMNADNTHVLDSFAEMNNLDLTKIPNYLEATSAGFDKLASCDFDVVKNGVEGIRTAFETLTDDKDAFATVGQHLSESFTSGFKDAIENEDVSPVCGAYGNALTQGFNAYFADSEHTAEVGRYVTEGIGKGMASDDAKSAIDDASSEIADYTVEKTRQDFQINSPSELLASEVGLYAGLGVAKGMPDSLDDPEFQSFLQQFVDGIAQKLHDAFAQMDTSNLLDLSSIFGVVEDTGEEGTSTENIFSQLLEDIQAFADAFANIDITNVVTQFTDLRDAVLDVSSAIGGTTGASESGDQAQGGTGKTSKQSKKSSAKGGNSNQQSNSGGSLTEAMQSFGDTATKVLGGGGEEGDEEEGSGVIGQFATLKTKVEDVTAAIGTEDDSGGDGKSGGKGKGKGKGKGEDSGTLIEALESEQEVAFDEEKGLPAQNEQWSTLESNIQKCVDAVQRLIDKLTELEEFSLTVHFSGHSEGGGGAKADGTFASHASGSFPVTMHSYAKGSNVGLEHDQRALIGEVGYEGLVRQNRFSLIGKNGAEMMSLKKGDIVFSHSQTKELLKNGKIHSRGKAVGTHSYADGTPLKSALKFAGANYSSTQLAALATKLTGVMDGISVGIDSIERRTTELANKVPNVTTNTANKTSNVTIGDIHVSGVQDVDGFAKAVKSYLPSRMLQELYKN